MVAFHLYVINDVLTAVYSAEDGGRIIAALQPYIGILLWLVNRNCLNEKAKMYRVDKVAIFCERPDLKFFSGEEYLPSSATNKVANANDLYRHACAYIARLHNCGCPRFYACPI